MGDRVPRVVSLKYVAKANARCHAERSEASAFVLSMLGTSRFFAPAQNDRLNVLHFLPGRNTAASRETGRFSAAGFTLIELIIVISIMLILISIAAPIYRTSIIRSKEAVLRDNLFTMRALIDQYTVDKQEAPQSLQDLVTAGYLRDVPMDPFTAANNTWEEVYETDVVMNPDQTASGITDVHSGSSLRSLAGDIYSSW